MWLKRLQHYWRSNLKFEFILIWSLHILVCTANILIVLSTAFDKVIKRFKSFNAKILKSLGHRTAKLQVNKLWEWFDPGQTRIRTKWFKWGRARCNKIINLYRFHHFSWKRVDHRIKVLVLCRPNRNMKKLSIFCILRFLRTVNSDILWKNARTSMTTATFGKNLMNFELLTDFWKN